MYPDFKNLNNEKSSLANLMHISGMVNLNFILHNNGCIQNLYKYRLSDTVINKTPIISCFADSHTTHIVYSSAKQSTGASLLSASAENREGSLHIVAQETIKLNVTGEQRIQICT